jgi:hypothetical protein
MIDVCTKRTDPAWRSHDLDGLWSVLKSISQFRSKRRDLDLLFLIEQFHNLVTFRYQEHNQPLRAIRLIIVANLTAVMPHSLLRLSQDSPDDLTD